MPRRGNPDYVVDPDRGSTEVPSTKRAQVLAPAFADERGELRAGARDLDRTVETMPGLSRQQRDRERAMPRGQTGELGHPRMERQLPAPSAQRGPLSSRQRKARSAAKRATQDRWTSTQYTAVSRLVGQPARWQQINDALSDHTGDAQLLDGADRAEVQRVDRAIQAYERGNDRGHVLYSNVEMPTVINRSNVDGFVRNNFQPGTVVAFDRFTAGAHSLHELDLGGPASDRTAVFEIQTRRGVYLGRSDSLDDTAHLLPRGMQLRVAGTHRATYERPDGTTGTRLVIQLRDTTPPE